MGGCGYDPVFLKGKTLLFVNILYSHLVETKAKSMINTVMYILQNIEFLCRDKLDPETDIGLATNLKM